MCRGWEVPPVSVLFQEVLAVSGYVKYFIVILLIMLLSGITSAQGDLDNDGIPDDADPETIVTADTMLESGVYSFQNLIISNSANLTLNSNTSYDGFKGVRINVANLRIDPTSRITANAKGYSSSESYSGVPGEGPGGGGLYGGGGGYGGRGGTPLGGSVYGSALQPVDLGSSGSGWAAGDGAGLVALLVPALVPLPDAGPPGARLPGLPAPLARDRSIMASPLSEPLGHS